MPGKIIIIIDKEGNPTITGEGLGDQCLAKTKEIEKALGSVESRKKTAEFYEPVEERLKIQEQEGESEN